MKGRKKGGMEGIPAQKNGSGINRSPTTSTSDKGKEDTFRERVIDSVDMPYTDKLLVEKKEEKDPLNETSKYTGKCPERGPLIRLRKKN